MRQVSTYHWQGKPSHPAHLGMVGHSPRIRQLRDSIRRVAATDLTALLVGETGTGKDLAAEALHQESSRRDGPFVVVDLAAIVPGLVESQLFGHEQGAFTGAHLQRLGALELANGGTLFLDEIGELPLGLQPKLLRAIERRQFKRVGGTELRRSDVRIIAATNRDLRIEARQGRFRPDLYHRLHVAELRLPALRERLQDIPLLVEHFLRGMDLDPELLGPEVLERFAQHDWPGNVRELRHVVERTAVLGEPPTFGSAGTLGPAAGEEPIWVNLAIPFREAKAHCIGEFERRYLERLLALHGGNVSQAARAAGLDRAWLRRILERRGLKRPPTSARGA